MQLQRYGILDSKKPTFELLYVGQVDVGVVHEYDVLLTDFLNKEFDDINITIKDEDDVLTADLEGKNGVFISPRVDSFNSTFAAKISGTSLPIVIAKGRLSNFFGMGQNTSNATLNNFLNVTDISHPITNFLSSTGNIQTKTGAGNGRLQFVNPYSGSDHLTLARVSLPDNRRSIVIWDAGNNMSTNITAPGLRILFFLSSTAVVVQGSSPNTFTDNVPDEVFTLFKNTIQFIKG